MPSTSRRFLILIPVAIAAAAYTGWNHFNQQPPVQDGWTLYGNIDLRQTQLAFNEAGRVQTIKVQEGERVQIGQVLAELDDRRYKVTLDAAKANVEVQQAVLDRLLAGSRPEDIERLRAVVAADVARLKSARLTHERTQSVARQALASQQSLDEARAAMDAAKGQLEADQAALRLAIIGPRQEDIDQARAALKAAHAELAQAEIAMSDVTLRSPSAGIIRKRILEPGDMASPSQPVFALALTEPVWARVYVDETELPAIRPGMPATITSEGLGTQSIQGWVGYISPTAEFTPKSVETTRVRSELVYQARVFACNPDNRLRLGMPVTVHVDGKAEPVAHGEKPCP